MEKQRQKIAAFRQKAAELRATVETLVTDLGRRETLELAKQYDMLANQIERSGTAENTARIRFQASSRHRRLCRPQFCHGKIPRGAGFRLRPEAAQSRNVNSEDRRPLAKNITLTAEHWRNRAQEARTLGEQLNDSASKAAMDNIARIYEGMAETAKKRESAGVKKG